MVASSRQISDPGALIFTPEEEAAIVAKITKPRAPVLNNPAYTANHILPGAGSALENCGKFKFNRRTAEGCGSIPIMHNCGRQSCPECYPRWASRAGKRAAAAVKGKMDAWAEDGHGSYGKSGGWIYSPPQAWAKSLILKGRAEELCAAGAAAAKAAGLRAFVIVFHPLRQVGGTRGGSTVALPPEEEWLYFQGKPWYISPHFHILGVGFFNRPEDPADLPPELKGWVLHLPEGSEDIKKEEDLSAWFSYLLSHADVHPDKAKNALRYYGGFHSSKVKLKEARVEKEPLLCDCGKCGSPGAGLPLYLFPTGPDGEEDYCSCAVPGVEPSPPNYTAGRVAFEDLPDRPAVTGHRAACLNCLKPLLANLDLIPQAWKKTEVRIYEITAAGKRGGRHRPPQRVLFPP